MDFKSRPCRQQVLEFRETSLPLPLISLELDLAALLAAEWCVEWLSKATLSPDARIPMHSGLLSVVVRKHPNSKLIFD